MTWERNFMVNDSEGRGLRRGLDGLETGKLVARLIDEPVDLHVDGDTDRVAETERVGAAVALDRDTVEAEQHGAIVAPRVHPFAHLLQGVGGQQIADTGEQRMFEGG